MTKKLCWKKRSLSRSLLSFVSGVKEKSALNTSSQCILITPILRVVQKTKLRKSNKIYVLEYNMLIDLDREWGTKLYKSLPPLSIPVDHVIEEWELKDPFKEAGFPHYRAVAFTQTASDAVTLCTEKRRGKGFIFWDNAYNAARGPFRSYSAVDKMNRDVKRGVESDRIRVYEFPRHGAPDIAAFWQDNAPKKGDVEFLEDIGENMCSGSVVMVEVLKNSIYDGALSAFCVRNLVRLCKQKKSTLIFDETASAVRCGRLWAFEYLENIFPDYIIFGKSLYASGVCAPIFRSSRKVCKKEFGAASRHSYGVTSYIMYCILKNVKIDLHSVEDAKKKLQMRISDLFEGWFSDFQWLGLLGASEFHDHNDKDRYVQTTLRSNEDVTIKFVRNENRARFMGWVDVI